MSADNLDEKRSLDGAADPVSASSEKRVGQIDISTAPRLDEFEDDPAKDNNSDNAIIITGKDASEHLLPIRDDRDPSLTFRSIVLATCLSCFQAVMSQIYLVRAPCQTIISLAAEPRADKVNKNPSSNPLWLSFQGHSLS